MALYGVLILGAVAYNLLSTETRYRITDDSYNETDFGLLAQNSIALGTMFLICSGVAAALGGLLRHNYLVWLSRRVSSRKKLIWGSLIGFEVSVLLVAILYWWIARTLEDGQSYQVLGNTILVCFIISLPWLLATVWASWRLAGEVRMSGA